MLRLERKDQDIHLDYPEYLLEVNEMEYSSVMVNRILPDLKDEKKNH